jgi:hypothetical protein
MLKREWEADIFPLLSIHIGGKTRNQLDEVWTPVSNGPQDIDNTTWKSHVEAKAIWEVLITHGKEHFSQASDTPFVTRFAWWQQELHAIELLRAHIGEWTITRMLDYWRVMCFTGYRLNWNPWIWIPFPIDSDCTLLCSQVDKNKIQQYCIRQ